MEYSELEEVGWPEGGVRWGSHTVVSQLKSETCIVWVGEDPCQFVRL